MPAIRIVPGVERLAPTIRRSVLLGFALVFVLWLLSSYAVMVRLADVEGRAVEVNQRLMRTEELLASVRMQVLLGSVYLRDALLHGDRVNLASDTAQLHETRQRIEDALAQYTLLADSPAERESLSRLQGELDDYWNVMLPVLEWEPTRRAAEANAYLRDRVVPKRQEIITISDRIQALNHSAFTEQQAQLSQLYGAAQRRIWTTSALVLLFGVLIAVVVTQYAGRLEARVRRQMEQDAQNTRLLHRLSASLVRAQEEERRTIARELHDEIGQVLTAIKVELAVAERGLTAAGFGGALTEVRSITDRALQTVRDLSHLLHPAQLDDLGLPAAVDGLLRNLSRGTGVATELVQDYMEDRLAPEVEASVYRIVQEALTNVARHADAKSCRVYLQRLPNTLLVTVEDDGKGFDPTSTATDGERGLGLFGIQERVAGFRGTFHLESAPGKGTRLTVELPALRRLPEKAGAEQSPEPEPSESVSVETT